MNVKYRVRLKNDRILGPFTALEIGELFNKNHIDGSELCQQFPIGDWRPVLSFKSLAGFIKKDITLSQIQNMTEPQKGRQEVSGKEGTNSKIKNFKEFKFTKDAKVDVDYEELEKKYKIQEKLNEEEENRLEKTRMIKRSSLKVSLDLDKTIVIPSKANAPKKNSTQTINTKALAQKKLENIEDEYTDEEIEFQKKIREQRENEKLADRKTEFFNLAKVLPSINAQLSVSEVELEQQELIEENNERIRVKELQRIIDEESESEEEVVEEEFFKEYVLEDESRVAKEKNKLKGKKKKGMSVIVAIAFMALFYMFLSPEEKTKETGPLFFNIKFPIVEELENKPEALKALVLGRQTYEKNSYLKKVDASQLFLLSLQKQFNNNEALGELLLTYSELLDDTTDSKMAANTIYKLIQLSENKMLSDLRVVTGSALFFYKIGKYQTGISIIKNYFRAKGAVSNKILTYYLDLLINAGDLVEARKIFIKLSALPVKPLEAYSALANFSELDNQLAEAKKTIDDGLVKYPKSALLLLKKADYLFKDRDYKKYEGILKKINGINAESSPVYVAKFYHYLGLLSAIKNKNKEASSFFKKSLAIKESDELRGMLASLEVTGDKISKALILESKVVDLIKKAKAEIKNKNLEAAFSYSIEAIDALPKYVPAILLHTQLQIKRGLFDSAINTLQNAISLNPGNYILKKNLVETYLKAYKFEDAQKNLIDLSQTKFAFLYEYASLMGDFYSAKKSNQLAIRWYGEAVTRNPLSDYDLFQLSKIFLKLKNFNEAKKRLGKALMLDPKNVDFLSLNAEILFEQDSTDIAIGYLRDAISDIGEDVKLLSTIALLYYRSGQINEFQNYYKRISALPKKDEDFFEFLIYASRLEEKTEDYINYSQELLKLNPGNLKTRLDLGEFLYGLKRYQEALDQFEEVKSKLASYPKVHFLLAKTYIALSDLKKAREMSVKELEYNPNLDTTYFISGEISRLERDFRDAIIKYEKAISLNPKSVEALMALGDIKLAQNYSNEALELFSKALREDKTNPEIHKKIGYAYKAAGQRTLAREKFEDYLKLNPGAADKSQIELQIKNLH